MSQARALSSGDVGQLRDELAAGSTPTVWFTASAVGVPEGRSGKVVALGEPAEGDFIQVRPAGSKDVLSFSSAEVTVVKPPRKRKEAEQPAPASTSAPAKESTVDKSAKAADSSPAKPAAGERAAAGGTRRKPRQPVAGATITLTASADGQWSVEVNNGKKRVLRPTSVSASAVAQAAKSLNTEVAEAVEPLLEAAREQQRERVEQLQQELATAQRMLDELTA